MLGFMYCIYFSLFCSCIFEVFGGGVKVACWCQLMVQTRAADQPVGQRGSNIAQQSSGITRGVYLSNLVSGVGFICYFSCYFSVFS